MIGEESQKKMKERMNFLFWLRFELYSLQVEIFELNTIEELDGKSEEELDVKSKEEYVERMKERMKYLYIYTDKLVILMKQKTREIWLKQTNEFEIKIKLVLDEASKLLDRISTNIKAFRIFDDEVIYPFLRFMENIVETNFFSEFSPRILRRKLTKMYIKSRISILDMELFNSLSDGRYRYPRCQHFDQTVKHLLCVGKYTYDEIDYHKYIKSTFNFPVCDGCNNFIHESIIFLTKIRDLSHLSGEFGLGFIYIKPLDVSF